MACIYYSPTGTTSNTWPIWCEQGATSTASGPWAVWTSNSSATTGATTAANGVWIQWNGTTNSAYSIRTNHISQPAETEAQRSARMAAEAARAVEWDRKRKEELQKQARADKRAERLLTRHLTWHQRREWRKHKHFHVQGSDGRNYRLRHGWAGNVDEVSEGKPISRFCIHPSESVPIPDNLLSQKLLLECDASEFRRIANRTALTVN